MKNDTREQAEFIEKVAHQLEKANFAKYVDLMQNPKKMVLLNFVAGLARGFGMAVGFTLLGAIGLLILQKLVLLNLPGLSKFLSEIVKMVQLNLR